MQVLLQYQSKSYYIIGQEVYYSIGRFITLSGSYYIIGRFLLHYRAVITVSGVYYIIGWYNSRLISGGRRSKQCLRYFAYAPSFLRCPCDGHGRTSHRTRALIRIQCMFSIFSLTTCTLQSQKYQFIMHFALNST